MAFVEEEKLVENETIEEPKEPEKHDKHEKKHKLFEETPDLENLYLYTVVVDEGVADEVVELLQEMGSSAQYIHTGREREATELLGMIFNVTNDRKAIIHAFIGEDKMPELEVELNKFFKSSRRNKGYGFSVQLSLIQGIRMYKYLTQSV